MTAGRPLSDEPVTLFLPGGIRMCCQPSQLLALLAKLLRHELLTREVIHADETSLRLLDTRKGGKFCSGWLWSYVSGDRRDELSCFLGDGSVPLDNISTCVCPESSSRLGLNISTIAKYRSPQRYSCTSCTSCNCTTWS